MRTNLKTLLATAAVAAVLAGGPGLYAYAGTPNQGSGDMMQGGQGGMMNMMHQKSQMMDTCDQMMKGTAQNHSPATPKEGKSPDTKG